MPLKTSSAVRAIGHPLTALLLLFFTTSWSRSQDAEQSATIEVHADQPDGTMIPIWNYFGYDEPNYTYGPNGKKLLAELAAASPAPVYVRVHNLLTTGDGSASLKWGSTNVYTEDAAGKPVYSWVILDRIFDTFHAAGIKPLVEIGFMPEALSSHPQPYRHNFPQGPVFTGWAYPPKDYQKWAELVFQFVHHLGERYGDTEVKTWLWEVWNEPDIGYWQGTRDEFSSYTTTPSTPFCARSRRLAWVARILPAPPIRKLLSSCAVSSIIAPVGATTCRRKLPRGSTSSCSIPKAHRNGKTGTSSWA